MKNTQIQEFFFIIVGVIILGAGIQVFYEPNHLVSGGATGLGIVIDFYSMKIFNVPVPLWFSNMAFDIPLFFIAFKILGKKFFKRAVCSSLLFSVALYVTSFLPHYKGDIVLICIYGGVVTGVGAGLVLRSLSSTGGTDLAALLLHNKMPRFSVSKIIFLLDAIVIALGCFSFGFERAMYAIISIWISSKCLGVVLEGISFAKAAFIISDLSGDISDALLGEGKRGVTCFFGMGMYTKKDTEILLCVFSQKEMSNIKKIIMKIDPNAFVLLTDMREVLGEGFSK